MDGDESGWEHRRHTFHAVPADTIDRRLFYSFSKRLFDIVSSVAGLVLGLPFILIMIPIIRLDTKGPAFFRQYRVGRNGRCFRIVKFRTMRYPTDEAVHRRHLLTLAESASEENATLAIPEDDRITRVGAFLRRWSLDELPNLWNVLKGDMSLVGPRPLVCYEAELLDPVARRRFLIRPGITGWAQVNGRLDVTPKQRTDHDLDYVDARCLRRDLWILLRTVPAVVRKSGP